MALFRKRRSQPQARSSRPPVTLATRGPGLGIGGRRLATLGMSWLDVERACGHTGKIAVPDLAESVWTGHPRAPRRRKAALLAMRSCAGPQDHPGRLKPLILKAAGNRACNTKIRHAQFETSTAGYVAIGSGHWGNAKGAAFKDARTLDDCAVYSSF